MYLSDKSSDKQTRAIQTYIVHHSTVHRSAYTQCHYSYALSFGKDDKIPCVRSYHNL